MGVSSESAIVLRPDGKNEMLRKSHAERWCLSGSAGRAGRLGQPVQARAPAAAGSKQNRELVKVLVLSTTGATLCYSE
jgi:hypothetical protein